LGGPEFELGISRRANLQQGIVAPIVKFKPRDRLRVTAVQIFRQAKNGTQLPHDLAALPPEFPEVRMPARRRAAPVVPGDQRNRLDFVWFEAAQIAVLDQVVRVTMMPLVTDVHARVVENRRIFQPFALFVGHAVDGACAIE